MTLSLAQATHLAARQSADAGTSEDAVLAALKAAARDADGSSAESLVPAIADLLKGTNSQRIRDAAALALSDLGDPRGAEALVEVLRRRDIIKAAGTLIHALDEMGAALPMDVLTSIVIHGSYEARAMALLMLEGGHISDVDPAAVVAARDAWAVLAASDDTEASEAAHAALEGLDDLERQIS